MKRYDWVWVDRIGSFYFPDFSDAGSSVHDLRAEHDGELLFVGLDEDIPNDWRLTTVRFPNGKIAYEIGRPRGN